MYTGSRRHTEPGDRSILVVDDDDDMRNTLAEQLTVHGMFTVITAASIAEARARASQHGAGLDAFLLDVSLPDGDGRDLCAQLRKSGISAPIILLTCWNGEADIVSGLQAGANDYVAKPFRLLELLARLRAHLRDHRRAEDAVFPIGPYLFRPAAKRLESRSRTRHIFLTAKESAILKLLCRADGRTVTKETLLSEAWGYRSGVNSHTLETHIYRLRQKIEPEMGYPQLLVSGRGGYRLDPWETPPRHTPAMGRFPASTVDA